MHGWAGGLHWKVAVDGRPPGANGRFFGLFLSNDWTWMTMGSDTQDERLCSMTSINKRNDSSLVSCLRWWCSTPCQPSHGSGETMAWHRHGGNGGSQLSRAHEMAMYYLRRRRARPAANLNRRGESAHMLHGSGGWVGCVGQAARHRRGISFASRAESARVVGAWQGRRRRGDHRRVAILVRLSGLLGLALRVCVYVCVFVRV
jgi:hypothetical protein